MTIESVQNASFENVVMLLLLNAVGKSINGLRRVLPGKVSPSIPFRLLAYKLHLFFDYLLYSIRFNSI